MKIFFSTRQKARDFATKRKQSGFASSVQDKGQAKNDLTGSKYAVNLSPVK